ALLRVGGRPAAAVELQPEPPAPAPAGDQGPGRPEGSRFRQPHRVVALGLARGLARRQDVPVCQAPAGGDSREKGDAQARGGGGTGRGPPLGPGGAGVSPGARRRAGVGVSHGRRRPSSGFPAPTAHSSASGGSRQRGPSLRALLTNVLTATASRSPPA